MQLNGSNFQTVVGKTIKITANRSGHMYGPVGTKIKVTHIALSGGYTGTGPGHVTVRINNAINAPNISTNEFEVVTVNKADLEQEIKDYQAQKRQLDDQILEINMRMAFLAEHKLEEFDDTQYKVWAVLQTIKETTSDIEKAKIIAKLISE